MIFCSWKVIRYFIYDNLCDFLLQNEKEIENAYKALIKHLEKCRILALESLFGNLKWKNMMEEVLIFF